MNHLVEIAYRLRERDKFILVGHVIPDGDCIGSLLALYLGLQSLGKKVQVYSQDPLPPLYHYLPAIDVILPASRLEPPVENVIFLDCGDPLRIGEDLLQALSGRSCSFNLDHHQGNQLFADYNYVDTDAAATAEIVFELLNLMQVVVDKSMARCLYAGIVMDTGSFMNSNTRSHTMRAAAQLIELGADVDEARIKLLESKPLQEVLLMRQALQHLELSQDGRIAWMVLPLEEVDRLEAGQVHPEGIINIARSIKGVEISLLFREVSPGIVKVGFRSRGAVDVARLAASFDGGGHKQAAGAQLQGSLEQVIARVLDAVKDVMA